MSAAPQRQAIAVACSSLIASVCSAPAFALDEYHLDDGVAETFVGVNQGFGLACLNHFTANPEALTIGSISIDWGILPAGTPATLLVYRDPNQDGNPIDAQWVYGEAITVDAAPGNAFNTYGITPQTFTPGESFFVGFWLHHLQSGWSPGALDTSEPQGASWLVVSSDNFWISDLSLNAVPPTRVDDVPNIGPGNWMIRANAVPGPSGLAAMVGAVAFRRRRR